MASSFLTTGWSRKAGGRGRPPLHQIQGFESATGDYSIPAVKGALIPGAVSVGVLGLVHILVTVLAQVAVVPTTKTSPRIWIERLPIIQVLASHCGAVLVTRVVSKAAVVAVVAAVEAVAVV